GSVDGKTVAVLGVAFKPNTDDVRDSASLTIIPALKDKGATVHAYDPVAMEKAKQLLPGVEWCADAYAAMDGADVLVILTEWNEFRALDLERVKQLLGSPVIVDLRNIYQPDAMAADGFQYISVGRATPEPAGAGS
ncbi:MAG TPA: UDP binding domain-containing protein, partial [Alphaproteobacteria bacterium]|nr:UDP binding domain-containing protein [Alphaproteobacteria bacterium]